MPPDEVVKWMDMAEADYHAAKHLFLTFRPCPFEIICFHCQQAAEKAIKAVYLAAGLPGGIPKKHDLTFILEQMKNAVRISDKLKEYADELNPYGVAVRYPSEVEIAEYDTKLALEHAAEILEWAKKTIDSVSN